jgi:3-methyladenine DNA glycosylase AlkC
MSEASELRAMYNRTAVEALGAMVASAHSAFPVARFVEEVMADLPPLSLMERAQRIAAGFKAHLPDDYPAALAILLKSLPAVPAEEGSFRFLPFLNFVSRNGLGHPELSLDAIAIMTRHFTAEFDIRPFIVAHPDLTWPRLHLWSKDPDWRVRRLATEGIRPRLPWGMRLKDLVKDPAPVRPIIDLLHNDPHDSVRRSAANSLNDIAKDHPDLAVEIARGWTTKWEVRHALRTLVKKGHPGALSLLGFGGGDALNLSAFTLAPPVVIYGQGLEFAFTLTSRESQAVELSIDYAIHHRKANGQLAPKVFKLAQRRLAPGESLSLSKRHAIRPITTRVYYPGEHRVEILVNGRSLGFQDFILEMAG